MKNKYHVYLDVINELKTQVNTVAIFLIGKGASATAETFQNLKDVDILVLHNHIENFERQITTFQGELFDISYINIEELNVLIYSKQNVIWIDILTTAKLVYSVNSNTEKLIEASKKIKKLGPVALTIDEIKYIRYDLFQDLNILQQHLDDDISFHYLASLLLTKGIENYFSLHQLWKPKSKKLLKVLANIDKILVDLISQFYQAQTKNLAYSRLEQLITYIVKPFGGLLTYFEKGKYPVDK